MRIRMRRSVVSAIPLLLLLGCSDGGPLHPQDDAQVVSLQLSANVSGTPVDVLVVEVTASDITTPLVFNLTVVSGTASGSIQVPPGLARTITVRAFDTDGSVTHDGSAIVDVSRGSNPPVHIALIPRAGHQPIDVTLAEVSVAVSPASHSLVTGDTVRLTATVTASGGVVDVDVAWATLNPALATVDANGLVTGVSGGTVTIVATYAGVGAGAAITVLTGGESWWYADADGDGFGDPATGQFVMVAPSGYVADGTDCDDADATTFPGATEVADGADNNCDGVIDEGVGTTWYEDADSDGYGNSSSSTVATTAPTGYVADRTDCNDADSAINPGATELANDGVDNDCDTLVDEADPDAV